MAPIDLSGKWILETTEGDTENYYKGCVAAIKGMKVTLPCDHPFEIKQDGDKLEIIWSKEGMKPISVVPDTPTSMQSCTAGLVGSKVHTYVWLEDRLAVRMNIDNLYSHEAEWYIKDAHLYRKLTSTEGASVVRKFRRQE